MLCLKFALWVWRERYNACVSNITLRGFYSAFVVKCATFAYYRLRVSKAVSEIEGVRGFTPKNQI